MKISLDWLSDFVVWREKEPRVIAERLTLSTAEVEKVEIQGELLRHCVVGQLLGVSPHPNADRLRLCDVQTDRGNKRVVCGGENLQQGMFVAFAHTGARVRRHGEGEPVELVKANIRGEKSEGMICSAEELGLEEQFPSYTGRNIVDLGSGAMPWKVGQPLRDALGLTDTIFHIDNHSITQRPDLFSHIGIARECVALRLGTWKKDRPTFSPPAFAGTPLPFPLRVEEARLMPRSCACIITMERLGETPIWMKKRLLSTGWRPLSLPIDITNYVAMEVGVPLHSFDADDIQGSVSMRSARAGEKITTLDGKEWEIPPGSLVLCDDVGVFDLLGIMGGLRSSTKESTRRIYLHSVSLDPVSIRRTMIATGIRTHAGTVYEKGVPYVVVEQGFIRAVRLFLDLVPGARIASRLHSQGRNRARKSIIVPLERVHRSLGVALPASRVKQALTRLEFRVSGSSKTLRVTVPLHRQDVREEADLVEEIARVVGHETFPPRLPTAPVTSPQREPQLRALRRLLAELGFCECVNSPFIPPSEGTVHIDNPLLDEQGAVHHSTLWSLLRSARENLERGPRPIALFEVANVFEKEGQHQTLGVLLSSRASIEVAGMRLRSILQTIFHHFGWGADVVAAPPSNMLVHRMRHAEVRFDGVRVGAVFELRPNVERQYGLPGRTGLLELNLSAFLAHPSCHAPYRPPPLYPTISYDETVSCPRHIAARSLLISLEGAHAYLQHTRLVSVFERGSEVSYTFRLTYGAPDRTLTEEEMRPVHAGILQKLRSPTPFPRTPASSY